MCSSRRSKTATARLMGFGRIYTGAFLRGGFCAELVLDEFGRMPLDIATPDPASIRFQRRTDKVLGPIWQAGNGNLAALFRWTVKRSVTFRLTRCPDHHMVVHPLHRRCLAASFYLACCTT